MKLCADARSLPDALEECAIALTFLSEAVCGRREITWEEDRLWGAQLLFDVLNAELMQIREKLIQHP